MLTFLVNLGAADQTSKSTFYLADQELVRQNQKWRTDNAKQMYRQTVVYKTLHRKLKQHEPRVNLVDLEE